MKNKRCSTSSSWYIFTMASIVLPAATTELQQTLDFNTMYPADTVEIKLIGDTLPSLHGDNFSRFTELRDVWLNENQVERVDSLAFINTKLTNLNLANNALNAFPNLIVNGNTLETVNLTGNSIQEVKCEYLQGLASLLVLDLSANLLHTVPGACSATAEHPLQELHLNTNPRLIFITQQSLQGLTNIRKITLVHTAIGQVGLDTIVSKLSATNQLVIKKVPTAGGELTLRSEVHSDHLPADRSPRRRLRRSASASNGTDSNMTLAESLHQMYSEFQSTLHQVTDPVDGPHARYIGFTYIALLSLEMALFLYMDVMSCLYVFMRFYRRKRGKCKSKTPPDERVQTPPLQKRRSSTKLATIHPYITVPSQVHQSQSPDPPAYQRENTPQHDQYQSETSLDGVGFEKEAKGSEFTQMVGGYKAAKGSEFTQMVGGYKAASPELHGHTTDQLPLIAEAHALHTNQPMADPDTTQTTAESATISKKKLKKVREKVLKDMKKRKVVKKMKFLVDNQ